MLFLTPDLLAALGDRWWPQLAKQEGYEMRKKIMCSYGENVMSSQMLANRCLYWNSAPSRKGCVVNG